MDTKTNKYNNEKNIIIGNKHVQKSCIILHVDCTTKTQRAESLCLMFQLENFRIYITIDIDPTYVITLLDSKVYKHWDMLISDIRFISETFQRVDDK